MPAILIPNAQQRGDFPAGTRFFLPVTLFDLIHPSGLGRAGASPSRFEETCVCTRESRQDDSSNAGFGSTHVLWEGTDKDGDGNGVYRKCKRAENTPGWNAYIVALP